MNFKAVLITAWIWFPALATAYKTKSGSYLVCKSPECTERAKLLNESLNITIDPCTDFYSYVCGKWESTHPLPSGRGSYDVYQEIGEDIPQKMSYILGNRTVVERNQSIIDKVAIMYKACLALPDTSDALVRVLNESGFNDWPILTEGNIFNSRNFTGLLRHMSISSIGHVELSGHPNTRSSKPKEIFIKEIPLQEIIKKVGNISAVIQNTIKFVKPEIDSSMLEKLTEELVEFANHLSDIAERGVSRPNNLSTLQAKFTNIPLSDLLVKEFGKVNITLYDTDQFNVHDVYYKELNELLATTKPNTFYNFAGIIALFPYLQYVQVSNKRELTESTTKSRNWRECITLLDESASDILDYLYVSNEPNHTAIKNEVEVIASRLKQAFNETLQNNSWIDTQTREALEKKVKEVQLLIGYPDMLLNMSVLETRYQYVPLFPPNISFTEALYYMKENLYKTQLRKFRYPKEGDLGWDISARNGRTYHDKSRMQMEIPYALFVPPFFQQALPRSLNYGGIGGAIAHELGDSFSDIAIDACQRTSCKWRITKESFELFNGLTPCFMKQYKAANEKLLEELGLEAEAKKLLPYIWKQTLNEDLADNTGLQIAFKAYNKVVEEECAGQDTYLTSLEKFSGMQLFLISNARAQCKVVEKGALIQEISSRRISLAQNRVNEAMKNMEDFAKAFNCTPGSPMYPLKTKTCSMW